MTVSETVLVVLTVVNVIGLFINLSVYKDNNTIKILMTQMHGALGTAVGRLQAQEQYLQRLGSAFSDFTNLMESIAEKIEQASSPSGMGIFRTIDGKYSASSLQDLIEKIKQDGREGEYLSDDEIEGLRKMFENDDDDENDFNPEQGKF